MKDFFKNFSIFFLGFFTSITILIIGLFFLFIHFAPIVNDIKQGSYLVYDFSGTITEKPQPKDKIFNDGGEIQLYELIKSIEAAKFDDKIDGVIINGDLVSISSVHAEELMYAFNDFKKSGKKIYSWFSTGNNNNYFLSTVSDAIYMPPTNSADLSLTGYSISIPYYKNLFDKYGVAFNVIHTGTFKGTGENYTRSSISDELKNQYTLVFNSLYNKKIADISVNRNIDKKKLEQLYQSGDSVMLTPGKALEFGLIDGLKNYDDLLSELFFNSKPKLISIVDYSRFLTPKKTGDKIAIIYAEGEINNYFSGNQLYNGSTIGAKSFNSDIDSILRDDSIKAVIIRVNSPGGSALASELMLQQIIKLKEKKKVYVSMGQYAASGGYYISLAADKIITSAYTITGSIGVVSMFMDVSSLLNTAGVNFETIKKNKYDDLYNISRSPTIEEVALLKNMSSMIYNDFTSHVINHRKIDKDTISSIADGKIWSGSQSVTNKLTDETGTLQYTIDLIKKDLNLGEIVIEEYPLAKTLFDRLKEGQGVAMNSLWSSIHFNSKEIQSLSNIFGFYIINGKKPALYLPFTEMIE